MTLPISAFVICHNEENYIEACIRSLHMCAEIVVVDSGSTDRTLQILASLTGTGFPIILLQEPWRGYAGQKQFALEQCTKEWCLSIDSDERISKSLADDMLRLTTTSDVTAWQVTRYPFLIGYGYVPPNARERFNTRLFRNGTAAFNLADKVHEGIRVQGKVEKAPNGGLLHFRPIGLREQILKENKYSSLKADMKVDQGEVARPWKMILGPVLYFLRLYLRNKLWRCGWAGFIQAGTGAVYSFLTEAKRWETEAVRDHPPVEPDASRLDHY